MSSLMFLLFSDAEVQAQAHPHPPLPSWEDVGAAVPMRAAEYRSAAGTCFSAIIWRLVRTGGTNMTATIMAKIQPKRIKKFWLKASPFSVPDQVQSPVHHPQTAGHRHDNFVGDGVDLDRGGSGPQTFRC